MVVQEKCISTKKDGSRSANQRSCKSCKGAGVLYTVLNEVAGLKIRPRNSEDISAAGFKTDQTTLEQRMSEFSGTTKEFVGKIYQIFKNKNVSFYICRGHRQGKR